MEHDNYYLFTYRSKQSEKNIRRVGYLCVASREDEGHIFITIAGSACSVSEPKFLAWKGTVLAKGRVDCDRPKIKKVETTLEEARNMRVSSIIEKLGLRPTCKYMDEEGARKVNDLFDNIDFAEADARYLAALDDIEEATEVDRENAELEMTR